MMMNSVANAAQPAGSRKPFALAVVAAVVAGACTFLNVYCTQPLLPLLQGLFHASELEVSLTVGLVTLSVALAAPWVGLVAESIGRKKVIVPALFAMGVVTLLTATAQTLHGLMVWRFLQGLFVPGVIAVIMAYINEEFPERAGTVMSAYVAGTVFGGFLGRFLTGLMAVHGNWRMAFLVLGGLDLAGALAVRAWLPLATHFVPAKDVFKSFRDTWGHLQNARLLAVCGMGFTVLFSLVGVFTYVNFYLAGRPFGLNPAALGSIFFVYLLGCVVTPLAGRFLDRFGFRRTALLSVSMSLTGLFLTLLPSLAAVIAGLAVFSSGIFISQSAASVLTGRVAEGARSAAAGLYVTCYYTGGSVAAVLTAWFWLRGGWPACVGLFAVASLTTLGFSILGGRKAATVKPTGPVVDTAI
jgi:MFS family permease